MHPIPFEKEMANTESALTKLLQASVASSHFDGSFLLQDAQGKVLVTHFVDVMCRPSALRVSISGPSTARADQGFELKAGSMDPDGALDPVIFAWVCTSDRGSCFSAGATPAVVGGSRYYVEAGSMAPGKYRIKVSAHIPNAKWQAAIV